MCPLTCGRELVHDLADRRREDVHAADDEHVVGTADAADPQAGPAAGARARPGDDVVSRPEADERGCAMLEVREDELAFGSVVQLARLARLGIDELHVHEAVRAEVHPVLLLALAEERRADVADAHCLGHLRAPALLELGAEGRLAAARLSRDEDAPDARLAQVVALGQVRGIRRREDDCVGLQRLDRPDQALGVAGSDRDVHEPDALEGGERCAGDERARVVRGDDPLAGLDARCRVAARRAGHPVLDVGRQSAGYSSARRSFRSSSRCGRARTDLRRGGRRKGSPR